MERIAMNIFVLHFQEKSSPVFHNLVSQVQLLLSKLYCRLQNVNFKMYLKPTSK